MGREDLRWYAYLHHFDNDGTYLCSDIEYVGTNLEGQAEVVARAEALLAEWLSQLDDLVYEDIEVCLFRTHYDGIRFGWSTSRTPTRILGMVATRPSCIPTGLASTLHGTASTTRDNSTQPLQALTWASGVADRLLLSSLGEVERSAKG
jgi:hypothetical protein